MQGWHVVALLAAALPASAKSPNSLGKELLSAVLADDVLAAASIFAQSEPAEANRLANAMDWRGKSVLMHAASRDFPKIVKLLLQNKARPDASDYSAGGVTALMLAARNGSVAAAEALVAGGASVHATTPAGTSVLMHAVANGSAPLVEMLLTSGANASHQDRSGATALSLAAGLSHTAPLASLLAHGADTAAADAQGSTALMVAAAASNLEGVKLLLAAGADPDAADAEEAPAEIPNLSSAIMT